MLKVLVSHHDIWHSNHGAMLTPQELHEQEEQDPPQEVLQDEQSLLFAG